MDKILEGARQKGNLGKSGDTLFPAIQKTDHASIPNTVNKHYSNS